MTGIPGFRYWKSHRADAEQYASPTGFAQLRLSGLDRAVVAKVGDIEISGEEFFISYEIAPAFVKGNHPDDPRTAHLKYMIYEKLLALDGVAQNVLSRPDVGQILEEIRQDLAVTEMFRETVYDTVQIGELEVVQAVSEATLNINFKYVYAKSKQDLRVYQNKLESGVTFDSFAIQGGAFSRELNFWEIKQKDAVLAEELTKLTFHQLSDVIETPRGLYLARVDTAWREMFITPAKYNELLAKYKKRLKRKKVETLAYEYAAQRLEEANPVIKSLAFKQLLAYFEALEPSSTNDLTAALLGNWPGTLDRGSLENRQETTLATTGFGNFTIEDFLDWYTLRRFPLNRQTEHDLAISLKKTIWRMVRDRALAREAYLAGFDQHPQVQEEMAWWQEKLVYWEAREMLLADLNITEELYTFEEGKRLQAYLNQKEQEIPVKIYQDILDKIPVTDLNYSKPIDIAVFKKQGTFPRIAYPTIDRVWERY